MVAGMVVWSFRWGDQYTSGHEMQSGITYRRWVEEELFERMSGSNMIWMLACEKDVAGAGRFQHARLNAASRECLDRQIEVQDVRLVPVFLRLRFRQPTLLHSPLARHLPLSITSHGDSLILIHCLLVSKIYPWAAPGLLHLRV